MRSACGLLVSAVAALTLHCGPSAQSCSGIAWCAESSEIPWSEQNQCTAYGGSYHSEPCPRRLETLGGCKGSDPFVSNGYPLTYWFDTGYRDDLFTHQTFWTVDNVKEYCAARQEADPGGNWGFVPVR